MLTIEQVTRAAKVLVFAVAKGGVGKTFTSVNIAYELVQLGLKVLLVDLDPQANATRYLGVEPKELKGTVFDILGYSDDVPLSEVVVVSEFGVHLAPGHEAMAKLEATAEKMFEFKLREKLEPLLAEYDFVLIDCPPALGNLTLSGLVAATGLVAPVKPGEDEVAGFYTMVAQLAKVKTRLNPVLVLEYVLVNEFTNTKIGADIRDNIQASWPDQYLGQIRRTTKIPESKVERKPLALHAPDHAAVGEVRAIAKAIAERSVTR